MSTAIAEREAFKIEPITYPVIAEKIAELASAYMPLRVNGLDDAEGLKICHAARMEIKGLRVSVDKKRKELKASALEYGRRIDSAAKTLTDLLAPIENHLQAEEDAVENQKEAIRQAEESAKRLKTQKRLEALMQVGVVSSVATVEPMSDEQYNDLLARATSLHAEKLAAEQRAAMQQKQEADRLAVERAALDKQKAEIAAEQAKLDAARREAEHAKALHEAEVARLAQVELEASRQRIKAAAVSFAVDSSYSDKLTLIADRLACIDVPMGPRSDEVRAAIDTCAATIQGIADGPL